MKQKFVILVVASIAVCALFAAFSIHKYRELRRFLSTHTNMLMLKEQISESVHNIERSVDDILESGELRTGKISFFLEKNNVQPLIKALVEKMEQFGCVECHGGNDLKIEKIQQTSQKIIQKYQTMTTAILDFGSGTATKEKVLVAESDFVESMNELKENFRRMEESYHDRMLKRLTVYPGVEILILVCTFLAIVLFSTFFYLGFLRELVKLNAVAKGVTEEGDLPTVDAAAFKSSDARVLAETLVATFDRIRRDELALAHQIEEMRQMNEELQASNQQLETIAGELERARRDLLVKVDEKTGQLERAYAELQELDNLKSGFLQNISHEFKTPLTPLFGYLKLFKRRELGELTPIQEQSIDVMISCTEKLYNTIDELIFLARLNVEKDSYMLKEMDFAQVVVAATNRVRKEAAEKSIAVTADLPGIPLIVRGEQLMLMQTILHLMRNAVKYSPERGEIVVVLNQEDGAAVVRIVDSGKGMPDKLLDEINAYLSSDDYFSARRGDMITIGLNILKRVVVFHEANVYYKKSERGGVEVVLSIALRT